MKNTKLIKWAGGKTQLLPELRKAIPSAFNTYYEPFIGGAALLLDIRPKNAVINDFNSELINMYIQVKNAPNALKTALNEIDNTKENYYQIRELDRCSDFNKLNKISRAARFIFLNKKGFNGLWRVNGKGFNNVPYNGSKSESYKEPGPIDDVHNYFKNNNIKILNQDFAKAVKEAQAGDFVYLDPPYDYENEKGFTSYQARGFDRFEQIRLKNVVDELTKKNVFCMISNNATSFILDIYKNYNIRIVKAKRMINSNGKGRTPVDEVIITNY